MTTDQQYVRRLESAQPDELRRMLADATPDEQRLLRIYLGDERYRRMRALALRQRATRGPTARRGNVVVLHGIMGAELSRIEASGDGSLRQIWVKLMRLAWGDLRYLQLDRAGAEPADPRYEVEATGIMKKNYGEQLLTLAERWDVRAFWYDWRCDLHDAARHLHLKLIEWFDGEPVHLVAHSMGGLVARTFILDYPDHWKALWDEEHDGKYGGRLVMLGTPNHGSYAVPQILTGAEGLIRKLALIDLRHSLDDLLGVVNTFVGSYQMMPALHTATSDTARREMERLYKAGMYDRDSVSQDHLDAARDFHEALRPVVDPERMVYVAGYDQPTYAGIKGQQNWANFRSPDAKTARQAYEVTLDGDGRVPHVLGLLETEDGKKVPTYYVEEDHGALPENDAVLRALDELLETGRTRHLAATRPKKRSRSKKEARAQMERVEQEHADDTQRIQAHLSLRQRSVRTDDPDVLAAYVTAGDREAEELLTRGFLSTRSSSPTDRPDMDAPFAPPTLTVRVVCGDIGGTAYLDGDPPVDAISVGHYRGVRPTNAELAIDRAISAARYGKTSGQDVDESDLLITRLTERGTIRGDHAQPFFLPDYRTAQKGEASDRVVVVAGMGDPGRFGVPELTVLSRELAWALGAMGKRHLASVLIGAGVGNLRIDEAVPAWIRGFKHALTGAAEATRVEHLTFVEYSPALAIEIDRVLRAVGNELDPRRMVLHYEPFSPEQVRALRQEENERRKKRLQREIEQLEATPDAAADAFEPLDPTRVTVMLDGDAYCYGAITQSASVPERTVRIDPQLVDQANDRLATELDAERQRDHGRVLERLLIPQDLRPHLSSTAPLVLLLDATTARIHWEMVAQPDVSPPVDRRADGAADGVEVRADDAFFLGISRGFTRQLRTQFASPPEPPPPPRRVLRVLVVADPAADAPLPGAEEEGIEVADLFERFNTLYADGENRVEVKRLFGPQEATRLNVLSELTLRSYDVLHFAGHCMYDAAQPAASGWIFSDGERLSARELTRIDRIPGFVFSNACESGITPDRKRTADLAPSFAEAFFARGVNNFVCTAWPVDDVAARTFARVLYGHLLGIDVTGAEDGLRYEATPSAASPLMYVAMREARRAIADTPNGFQTWGAYQHYGSPYFRFFGSPPSTFKKKAKRSAT